MYVGPAKNTQVYGELTRVRSAPVYLESLHTHRETFSALRKGLGLDTALGPGIHLGPRGQLVNAGLARLWRDDCLRNHELCRLGGGAQTSPLPTRLLDVSNLDMVVLREMDGLPRDQYVALSYSWGNGARFRTLRHNATKHRRGIPVRDLPATFQDAISIANWIGYRYIWIDAMCIVQDDPVDNANEIRNMGDIYRYAVLTICAQGAASSHDGLFANRNPSELHPCETSAISPTLNNGETRRVVIKGGRSAGNHLESRGWILQEEVLTSRALIFTGEGMKWRCSVAVASESDPEPNVRPMSGPDARETLAVMHMWLFAREQAERRSCPPPMITWYNMLQLYSDRLLTYPSDILAAVKGLSAIFAEVHHVTYIAGLWREDFLRGLTWYVANNDARGGQLGPETKLNAPSWSWPSVGKVRIKFLLRTLLVSTDGTELDMGTEVLEAFCSSDDPVKEALRRSIPLSSTWSLRLLGPTRKFILLTHPRFTKYVEESLYGKKEERLDFGELNELLIKNPGFCPRFPAALVSSQTAGKFVGQAALDSGLLPSPTRRTISVPLKQNLSRTSFSDGRTHLVLEGVEEVEVTCIAIEKEMFTMSTGDQAISCLVLVPRPRTLTYSRLGLAYVSLSSWTEGCDAEDDRMECEIV